MSEKWSGFADITWLWWRLCMTNIFSLQFFKSTTTHWRLSIRLCSYMHVWYIFVTILRSLLKLYLLRSTPLTPNKNQCRFFWFKSHHFEEALFNLKLNQFLAKTQLVSASYLEKKLSCLIVQTLLTIWSIGNICKICWTTKYSSTEQRMSQCVYI